MLVDAMIAFLAGFQFAVICLLCWVLLKCDDYSPPAWWLALQKKGWWRNK